MQLIKCMERPLAKMYQINLVERKEPFKFGRPNLEFWLAPTQRITAEKWRSLLTDVEYLPCSAKTKYHIYFS